MSDNKPAISDSRKNEAGEYEGTVALWFKRGEANGKPYRLLSGTIDGQKVTGEFTADFKNAAEHPAGYPVLKFKEDKGPEEKGDFIENAAAWPQNDRKDGREVDFQTLVIKIGDKTHYARVWDNELQKQLGFAGEPRKPERAQEAAPAAPAASAASAAPMI